MDKLINRSPSESSINANPDKPKRNILTALSKMFTKSNSTINVVDPNASNLKSTNNTPTSNNNELSHNDRATINNLPPPPDANALSPPKTLKRISSLQPSALPAAPHSINPRRQSLPNIRPKPKQPVNTEFKFQGQVVLLDQKERQFKELKSNYGDIAKGEADTMSPEALIQKANDLMKRIAQSSEFMIELLKQREVLKLDKVNNDNFVAELIKSIEQH